MANTITPLIPTLIADEAIAFLRTRSAFLSRIRVENRQEQQVREGGNTVTIPKPTTAYTPTTVSYTSAANPQAIVIPSVPLTFGNHKEVKFGVNELESRTARGNYDRILELAFPGALEGLANAVDQSVAQLYSSVATTPVGTAGVALTDAVLRSAAATLAGNNVDVQSGGVTLVTTPGVYYNQLLGNAGYVQAYQIGGSEAIRGGKIPSLYGINVDYSPNIVTTATSPVTIENMMFARDAFVIGFVEFEPATNFSQNAPVDEAIVTDPVSGITIRVQKYYDASLRTGYYQMDVKWGTAVLDENRAIPVRA
jgi:hypothetical protein